MPVLGWKGVFPSWVRVSSVLVLRSVCACVRSKGYVPVLVLQWCVFVDLRGNVPVLGSKG